MTEEQEFGNCPNCNQPTVDHTDGVVFDSYPSAYPTKCTNCGWTGHSEKLADRQEFNKSLKQVEAET